MLWYLIGKNLTPPLFYSSKGQPAGVLFYITTRRLSITGKKKKMISVLSKVQISGWILSIVVFWWLKFQICNKMTRIFLGKKISSLRKVALSHFFIYNVWPYYCKIEIQGTKVQKRKKFSHWFAFYSISINKPEKLIY